MSEQKGLDLYATLGVSKEATQEQIKQAYYSLAKRFHPDTGRGDSERFKRIARAYAVLSDPDSRARYDRDGTTDGPDNSAAKIMQGLSELLIHTIQTCDVEFTDLREVMLNELASGLAGLEAGLEKINKAKEKMEKARKRFGGDKEAFEAILLSTIDSMKRKEAAVKEDMDLIGAIKERVTKVSYTWSHREVDSSYKSGIGLMDELMKDAFVRKVNRGRK